MPINLRKILLVFASSLFTSYLISQHITHLGVENGLSGIQTFSSIQDKNGFVWISTRFGIDRYDGENIKNYPLNVHYSRGIVRMTHILLDRDSALWAFTDRGTIYKYDEDNDEFRCTKDLATYLRIVHFDASNNMWLGVRSTFGQLLNGSFVNIKSALFKDDEIRDILDFDNNNLLVVTNKSIYKFDKEKTTLSPFAEINKIMGNELSIESVFYERQKENIWIGSVDKGLFVYHTNKRTLEQIKDSRLLNHPILTIMKSDESHLLLGTEGLGICMFDKNEEKVTRIYNNSATKDSFIEGDGIYNISKDKDGKIWVSTFSNGIYIFDFWEQNFHSIKHEENSSNSLSNDLICDILQDSDDNLWVATNNGLNKLDKKNNRWLLYLPSKNVLCLHEDSRSNIWVGTYASGIYVFNKNGKILSNYTNLYGFDNAIGTNFVYTICEDQNGNIWSGGKKGQVAEFNVKQNKFTQINISQANCIIPKGKNQLLIADESDVYEVDINTHKITRCAFNKNLLSPFVHDIYIESDSIVWLATYGAGLNRCNMITGSVTAYTQKNGLASDFIYALLVSGDDLWMSSENGLIKFNIKQKKAVNFSTSDGIPSNRFRQLSKEKTDKYFYFGSYDGVCYFDPNTIKTRPSRAKIFLQNFYLFNKQIKPDEKKLPLTKSLEKTDKIILNYKQHSFSIDFTTIDFTKQKNRRYMWKLDGLDKEWIGPTAEHIANYTNLEKGKYIFYLQCLGDNNVVLDQRKVEITITPPFWETVWARIIELLILAGIGYSIYVYVKQRFIKKQSEEKINFFINAAHDIRTPLTLISAPLFELKEKIEPSKQTDYLLHLITSNLDRLNKMFSHLLDFQKVNEQKDLIVVGKHNVNAFLEEKIESWELAAVNKKINLRLELPPVILWEWFDMEKMDKTIDNLLSNAIKYTPEGGTVLVVLAADIHNWNITVSDTGIGIPRQDKDHLFKRFYRARNAVNSQITGSGLGLLLIQKYIQLHKAIIKVNSTEEKGTEFYLQFRHGKEHYRGNIIVDMDNLPVETGSETETEQKDIDKLKIKLLIVEDNDDLRTFMKISLSHYYNVSVAQNGSEAWEIISKIYPDVIVSDLQMPEMDGFELCAKVKNTFETSHIPVILLTVVNDERSMKKGFGIGADDYIEKPFDIKYLRLKIDSIIQNRKILRLKFLGIEKSNSEEQPENENNAAFIKTATQIITNNITNAEFSIAEFSKEMGLSRSLLYTKFNTITGYTPNDFIKIVRMNKAIEYFREKKYSINEVAYMVGFEDPAYFSNCFKKIYGESPRQFIEKNIL